MREDLFSAQEGDGTADGVLVGRLGRRSWSPPRWLLKCRRAGHGHWHGKGRCGITVTTASIIWSCRSRRVNSALTSSGVSMNRTPRGSHGDV